MRNIILFLLLILTGCKSTGPVSSDELMFVAHRGITTERLPENTLKAFQNVIDRGVSAVELDVRTTNDGFIVLMHDATVNRTTDGFGRVDNMSLSEIKNLDAGDGERVPTITETLDLFKGTDVIILIDIKDSDIDLVNLIVEIEQRDMVQQIILGPRNVDHIKIIKWLNSDIKILGFTSNFKSTEEFVKSGIDIVRVKDKWIDRTGSQLVEAKKYGLPVWVTSYYPSSMELKLYPIYGISAVITDNI